MNQQPRYWRSFEELAQTPEFRAFVEDEFPNRTPDWNDPSSRRRFLTLMGASVALAGASACTVQPKEGTPTGGIRSGGPLVLCDGDERRGNRHGSAR
jgi:MoCo/4Fe-4S cofactor protein with predicted Tat translocation signal